MCYAVHKLHDVTALEEVFYGKQIAGVKRGSVGIKTHKGKEISAEDMAINLGLCSEYRAIPCDPCTELFLGLGFHAVNFWFLVLIF